MLGTLLEPLIGAYTPRTGTLSQSGGALWGYRESPSGVTVTEETAMNIAAVFNATMLISDAAKTLPIFVYQRTNGGREQLPQHGVYRLLHDRPNPDMSPSRFKKLMIQWALQWGSGPAEIERNQRGEPINLWPIHPSRRWKDTSNGRTIHKIRNSDGSVTELESEDVFETMGYSCDGMNGISVVGMARNSLGLTVAAEDYGAKFFAKDAAPNIVITHPKQLTESAQKRLRQSWISLHGRNGTAEGVAVLEEGTDIKRFDMPHGDAQFLETRQFQVVEIARWFNIPPHKLKDLGRATWSNIEQMSIEYVSDTLMPWLVDFEEEADRKLLTEQERKTMFCEFKVDAALRADSKARAEALQIQRQNGVISANEWRAMENMNTLGEKGDLYIIPANFQPMTDQTSQIATVQVPQPAQQPDPEPSQKEPTVTVTSSADPDFATIRDCIARAHGPAIADVLDKMRAIELNECKKLKSGDYVGLYAKHVTRFVPSVAVPLRSLAGSLAPTLRVWTDYTLEAEGAAREAAGALSSSMIEWFKNNPGNLTPITSYDPQSEGLALALDFCEQLVTLSRGAA